MEESALTVIFIFVALAVLIYALVRGSRDQSVWEVYPPLFTVKDRNGSVIDGKLVMRRKTGDEWEYRAPSSAESLEYLKDEAW